MSFTRNDGRTENQMRPFSFTLNPFGHADASVLFTMGNTKVLAAVTLLDGVPPFLRNSNNGWMTAEYSMLPTSTRKRSTRDSSVVRPRGRNIEIARLIGRSLRSVIDLKGIGEKTIQIDCDVLQADGGTRTACITAASYALQHALGQWNANGRFKRTVTTERIVALSAGIVNNVVLVDLDQDEDCTAQADVNFVMAGNGDLIEVQGTAEQKPFSWQQFVTLKESACTAMQELLEAE
jgi:ribonuclease PH